MKKIALLTAACTMIGATATADDLSAKLQGRFQFEGAALNQKGLKGDEKNVSANRKNFAFNSKGFVGARIEHKQHSIKYGAQLGLFTTSQSTGTNAYDRSHVFIESDLGKLELGSNFDAATNMEINAMTYACGAGSATEDYARLEVKDAAGNPYTMEPYPYTSQSTAHNGELARKVTYYTPKFNGFQLGVSYTPDTGNAGSLKVRDGSVTGETVYAVGNNNIYTDNSSRKDVIAAGVTFEHEFSKDASMKLAVVTENGSPAKKGKMSLAGVMSEYKMPKLKSYNVGGIVTKGNYSLVASYADQGKYVSDKVFGKDRKRRFYNVGAIYTQGPVGASFSYYKSDVHGNKMDTYVIGSEYKLAKGLVPYAEFGWFNGKGSLPKVFNDKTQKKLKGSVFLLGLKMSF